MRGCGLAPAALSARWKKCVAAVVLRLGAGEQTDVSVQFDPAEPPDDEALLVDRMRLLDCATRRVVVVVLLVLRS